MAAPNQNSEVPPVAPSESAPDATADASITTSNTTGTTTSPPDATTKPIHSLVLDTGPLIKNDPPVDVLRARAEHLYTLPSIIPEIRDAATRSRVETTLMPFVTLRSPKPQSVRFITDFARRTGDLEVLSRPDIEVLALTYELECERNGGDWRLRNTPGQKTLNGKSPRQEEASKTAEGAETEANKSSAEAPVEAEDADAKESTPALPTAEEEASLSSAVEKVDINAPEPTEKSPAGDATLESQATSTDDTKDEEVILYEEAAEGSNEEDGNEGQKEEEEEEEEEEEDEDDEGGWITPSNVNKHKARDALPSANATQPQQPVTLQAAVLTSDFAMQNVALRVNLNLVSPALSRISRLRTWVLRCHACFRVTRAMDRRFCPSCGQPSLLRAACTVDDRTGQLTVHLKRNFQWNNRGNVYSVPKPVHGSAHGRAPRTAGKGKANSYGGQGGWGRDLILAEDQKEYTRAVDEQRRTRAKDIMDDDYMPSILGGRREGPSGKIRVGAGRSVNSKRKK
jgi:RNA-binding protein NOB1